MERSCKNCQQRRIGCHANCERYKADCAQDAKRRAYEKQFAYMDSMPQTATALKKTLAPRRVGGLLAAVQRRIIETKTAIIHDRLMGGPAKETQA